MRVPAQVLGKIDWRGCQLSGYAGGPQDTLYLLLGSQQKSRCWRVLCVTAQRDWECAIGDEHPDFHFVQPLPEGLLLAHARQSGGTPNGRVYDTAGQLLRELALGDGIASLQATTSGTIWASYFDEGALGGDTVGAAGLVRFDAHGTPVYRFQPSVGLDRISDCYAINVESSDCVWLYYYTPFLLVRLRNDAVNGVWQPNLAGAMAFAALGNLVVMHAGYGQNDWRVLNLHDDGTVSDTRCVDFIDECGDPLPIHCARARGRLIWFIQNSTVYRVDISQLS